MMKQIMRDQYVHELLARENNGFIKVITGVRRSGKSYLLFRLFVDKLISRGVQPDHIIRIALDDIQNDMYREPHALYNHIRELITDDQTYYVLLDEIQFVYRFPELLNSLLRIENVDVDVTGSNSRFLSSDILTEFRGRGDELRVYPLSFEDTSLLTKRRGKCV